MQDVSGGRMVMVLVDPAATFARIVLQPTWGVTLAFLMAVTIVSSAVTFHRMDFTTFVRQQVLAAGQNPTTDVIQEQVDLVNQWGGVVSLIGALTLPVLVSAVAFVFWIAVSLLGHEVPYGVSFSVVLHAMMPFAFAALLTVALALSQDTISAVEAMQGGLLISHLGFLAPDTASPALQSLLNSIDLFSLWTVFLLTIGFRAATRVATPEAAATVLLLWLAYVALKVGCMALWQ